MYTVTYNIHKYNIIQKQGFVFREIHLILHQLHFFGKYHFSMYSMKFVIKYIATKIPRPMYQTFKVLKTKMLKK